MKLEHDCRDFGFSSGKHKLSSRSSHDTFLLCEPLPQLAEHSPQGPTRQREQASPKHVRLFIGLVETSQRDSFPGHSTARYWRPGPHKEEH